MRRYALISRSTLVGKSNTYGVGFTIKHCQNLILALQEYFIVSIFKAIQKIHGISR